MFKVRGYNAIPYPIYESKMFNNNYNNSLKALIDPSVLWEPGSSGVITINFLNPEEPSSSSIVGKNSSYVQPSMEFGFLDPPTSSFTWNGTTYNINNFRNNKRSGCNDMTCAPNYEPGAVILHEFIHALGGMHEHQNNMNVIYIKENVYSDFCDVYFKGDPDCREIADRNIFDTNICYNNSTGNWDSDCLSNSEYDPDSIMLYSLNDSWIDGPNPTKLNFRLSKHDKLWLSQKYPLDSTNKPNLKVKFLNGLPWQKALVVKTVSEHLQPYVGVNFIWDSVPLDTESKNIVLSDLHLILIISGCVLVIFIIIMFFYYK
jgi:hypothetical protein